MAKTSKITIKKYGINNLIPGDLIEVFGRPIFVSHRDFFLRTFSLDETKIIKKQVLNKIEIITLLEKPKTIEPFLIKALCKNIPGYLLIGETDHVFLL